MPSTPCLRPFPKDSFQTAFIFLNGQDMITNQTQEEVGGGINRLYRACASAETEELAEHGSEPVPDDTAH